jgi:hypothetical protein
MTTWKTELSGSFLSAAVTLPIAYAIGSVSPLAGALLLGSAEIVSRVARDVFRSVFEGRFGFNSNFTEAVAYLSYYAGGILLSNYAIEVLQLAVVPLPVSFAMLTGALLVVNFVRKKLAPMPAINLWKELLEEMVLRPGNGAASAALSAHLFTSISLSSAALMGGLTFLATRVSVFVMKKMTDNEGLEALALAGGAFGGWQLSILALAYFGFPPIAFPVVFLGGVGAVIPAVIGWSGLSHVSEIAFRQLGWKPAQKSAAPLVDTTPKFGSPLVDGDQ